MSWESMVEKRNQTFLFKKIIFLKNLSPTFFVVPRAAVGDFCCWAHGSNFVALTATLEVKLSSRTLVDIMEAKNVGFLQATAVLYLSLFFSMYLNFKPNCHTR